MNTFFALVAVAAMLALPGTTSAAYDADDKVDLTSDHVADDTFFNKIGDWFATVGKPEPEKERIKAERRADRIAKRTGEAVDGRIDRAGDSLERAGDKIEDKTEQVSRDIRN